MPSLDQLKAEASRCDRMAELHAKNVAEWSDLRDQQLKYGNRETAAELAVSILGAMEAQRVATERAKECRRQIDSFHGLASLVFDVTARTIRAA